MEMGKKINHWVFLMQLEKKIFDIEVEYFSKGKCSCLEEMRIHVHTEKSQAGTVNKAESQNPSTCTTVSSESELGQCLLEWDGVV